MFIANISIAATPDALYDHWQGAKQGEPHWNATRIRTGSYKDKSRSEKESWKLCGRKSHIPVRSVLHSLLTVLLSNSAFHHLIQWPSENLQRCQMQCLAPKTWMFNGRQHIKSESSSFLLSRVFVLHRLPSSVSGPQPAHVAEMLDLKKKSGYISPPATAKCNWSDVYQSVVTVHSLIWDYLAI